MAIDDALIDGGDALVFPAFEERINALRGPITIEGGVQVNEERFLNDPFRLPGETNLPLAEGTVGTASVDLNDDATLIDLNAMHVNAVTGERPVSPALALGA